MVLSEREGRGRLGSVRTFTGAASESSSLYWSPRNDSLAGLMSDELACAVALFPVVEIDVELCIL